MHNVIVLSDAGGGFADPDVPITITLDDDAASEVPDSGPDIGSLLSGTYRPRNFEAADVFPTPAPSASAATNLAVFVGTNPNSDWQLCIVDDDVFDADSIANGWILTVVSRELPPPNTFAGWAAGFGLAGTTAAADADPDGDGLPNGVEFVLGGNPMSGRSAPPIATTSGGNMAFTLPRADASETPDVTLTVESGTNLVTWPVVFNIGPNTGASSSGVSVTENGTAPDTITVTISQSAEKIKFARLNVRIVP